MNAKNPGAKEEAAGAESAAVRHFLNSHVKETMSLRETVPRNYYEKILQAVRELEETIDATAPKDEDIAETGPIDEDIDEIVVRLRGEIRRTHLAKRARNHILKQGTYEASDVQKLREDKWKKPSEALLELADRRRLIALRPSGTGKYCYPEFQFTQNGDVVETVAIVNPIIGAGRDTWSKASWWFRGNRFLPGSSRPVDFLTTSQRSDGVPTELITAANFEADPFQEGNW